MGNRRSRGAEGDDHRPWPELAKGTSGLFAVGRGNRVAEKVCRLGLVDDQDVDPLEEWLWRRWPQESR